MVDLFILNYHLIIMEGTYYRIDQSATIKNLPAKGGLPNSRFPIAAFYSNISPLIKTGKTSEDLFLFSSHV